MSTLSFDQSSTYIPLRLPGAHYEALTTPESKSSFPSWHREERDILKLSADAQELAEQRHEHEAHCIDRPPLPARREAVIERRAPEVDQVGRHGKVETLFGALDDQAEEACPVRSGG